MMSENNNGTEERVPYFSPTTIQKDLTSGLVVFLVALPLCLGIALASGAPLFAGLLAGIVGGLVIGPLSGSHTSVSGPAAGLTAIVSAQIIALGSFEAFLMAVVIGGIIQVGLGLARTGALSAFFPSSVIKGLLAAIGVIIILKQIPHVLGHDLDPVGEMSFQQPDKKTTFSELWDVAKGNIHTGAAIIGLISLVFLIVWDRIKFLKKLIIPGPLVVVILGVILQELTQKMGTEMAIGVSHLVQIPVANSAGEFFGFFKQPDVSQLLNPRLYLAGVTIAIVASLETLLNLEAVDKLDTRRRHSPPNRELLAQGVGNIVCGMIGALPTTSVIVRSSVNVSMGSRTKMSAIYHGIFLLVCVGMFPMYLNKIPLASLAAILIVTGFRLASPKLFRQMWREGRYQFIPFVVTVVAIVFTDLLVGILIGLAVSVFFILHSNLRRPIRRIVETHLGGELLHIVLSNQVSFLNKAALDHLFNNIKDGTNVLIDGTDADYIDPDVLSLIQDFKDNTAPAHDITVNLRGFRAKYEQLQDVAQFADYSTRELKENITPQQVLELLKEGNRRFRTGNQLSRNLIHQVGATARGQNPFSVILGCIDSRVPVEVVFDLGIGDVFSMRVAGNVVGEQPLASIEYAVAVAGVKLVRVMGHTRCGAVTSSVELFERNQDIQQVTGCSHLHSIVDEISQCMKTDECKRLDQLSDEQREALIDEVAKRNVIRSVNEIVRRSEAVRKAIESGQLMVVGALYDVRTGEIEFMEDGSINKENNYA